MEALLKMTAISQLIKTPFKTRDGQDTIIESFAVNLSNGLDSILAETSKIVTNQFKDNPPIIGRLYACHIRLQVINYKRDGKDSSFFKAILIDCKEL